METKITIGKDGKIYTRHMSNSMVFLNLDDFDEFVKDVLSETSYKNDVLVDLDKRKDCQKYDINAIKENSMLIDALVKNYANKRFENNGNNPDYYMSWRECLDETFEEFFEDYEEELEEYLLK